MRFVFLALALFAGAIYWMLHGEPTFVDTPIAGVAYSDESQASESNAKFEVSFDRVETADGDGSLRIDAQDEGLYTLLAYRGGPHNVSFRGLLFSARVRTEDVQGPVFLILQAGIGRDHPAEMPVAGLEDSIEGDTGWTTLRAFAGNPQDTWLSSARLQIRIGGPGTVWVDDVRLVSRQAI